MNFIWPTALVALVVIPGLVLAYLLAQRRRRRYAIRYSSILLVKEAAEDRHFVRQHVPPTLFTLGLTAMLFALARPVTMVSVPEPIGTVILAIDASASMSTSDLKPNRLEAAKSAARAFVNRQPATAQIGVVAFSSSASLVQAPTTDRTAVSGAINRLQPQVSTAIGSGILTSLGAILDRQIDEATFPSQTPEPAADQPEQHVPGIIVLLTDGRNVEGPEPLQAARTAASAQVRIYTVGIGSRHQGLEEKSAFLDLDENTLMQIANATGGEYYFAGDENTLASIYSSLGSRFVLESQQVEITAVFAALAAGLALLSTMFSWLWTDRLP